MYEQRQGRTNCVNLADKDGGSRTKNDSRCAAAARGIGRAQKVIEISNRCRDGCSGLLRSGQSHPRAL
jgi:hypothetical protein